MSVVPVVPFELRNLAAGGVLLWTRGIGVVIANEFDETIQSSHDIYRCRSLIANHFMEKSWRI